MCVCALLSLSLWLFLSARVRLSFACCFSVNCTGNADKRINFEEFLPILERVKDKKPRGTEADYVEGV